MNAIETIIADGADQLLVVSDFDRTLTRAFVNGQVTALISIMVRENIFDEDYIQKARSSYEKYRPIELDESLPMAYRISKMEEWWNYVADVLIDKKLSKAKLKTAIAKARHYLREGASELLTKLSHRGIPLIIFSANGLGTESIEYFLEYNQIHFPNIKVVSNQYVWDAEGVAVSVIKPLIHVFNKDFGLVKNSPYFESVKHRRNVLMMGDALSDIDMVKNCDYHQLLKVGFLNENIDGLRPKFQETFDLIIENDGPMHEVSKIIDQLK